VSGTGDGSYPPEVHAGKAPDNLWIITHGTTVTSPPNVPSPPLPPGAAIREAWANTPTDAWIVARPSNFYDGGLPEDPAFFHWDGTSWTSVATPASSTGDQRLWGSGAHDVWQTSTADFLLHWNGTAWTKVIPVGASDPARHINVVWGSASNDVWAVGGDASGAKAWRDLARHVERPHRRLDGAQPGRCLAGPERQDPPPAARAVRRWNHPARPRKLRRDQPLLHDLSAERV
jgi:hypothetical protein